MRKKWLHVYEFLRQRFLIQKRRLPVFYSKALLLLYLLSLFFLTTSFRLVEEGWSREDFGLLMPVSFVLACSGTILAAIVLGQKMDWRGFLKFGMVYLGYWFSSYLVFATANVNNPDFELWNFQQSDFLLSTSSWISLIFLILVAIFLYQKEPIPKLRFFYHSYSENTLLALVLSASFAGDRHFLEMFSTVINAGSGQSPLSAGILLVVAVSIAFAVAYSCFGFVDDMRQNRASLHSAIASSIFLAIVFNYTIQSGIRMEGELLGHYIFSGAIAFQGIILFLLYLLIYLLVNRYMLATGLIVLVSSVVSIVNGLKESMRSEPLLITDFTWLSEIDTIFGFVDESLLYDVATWLVVGSILFLIAYRLLLRGPVIGQLKKRMLYIGLIVSLFAGIFAVFRNETAGKVIANVPIISKLNNKDDISWFGFSTNARYKSLMFVWAKQLSKTLITKPDGYSQERIEEIVANYTRRAQEINQQRTEVITDQTVIYLLSESFANPEYVPGVHLSQDVIPQIKAIKEGTTSGLMRSDFYGGGTANMEFQSLTGLPFYNLSPSVSIAYTEVVPKMTYFPSISQLFAPESRIVIHPASAKNYNRSNIYKSLDFAKFIAQKDSDDPISAPVAVGALIGDATVYANILNEINTAESQFFSAITMQNHSPWISDSPQEITASGDEFTDEENEKLTSYSRLLSYTDSATKEFLDQLAGIDKKITVVFYGDHLPGLYPQKAFHSRPEAQYQTDYFIWSNFKTEKLDYPYVNSSDFTAELFQHTNTKVTPYIALLTDNLQHGTSEENQVADDLYMLQYDLIQGKGYIKQHLEFFEQY